MRLYRIASSKFIHDLSGEGARIAGGRWNSVGVPVLYTAATAALAALEAFVHTPPRMMGIDFSLATLEVPDKLQIEGLAEDLLPVAWHRYPAPRELCAFGDAWAKRGARVGLRVPSAVVPDGGEKNVLLNPRHPQYLHLKIIEVKPFRFDLRMRNR